MNAFLGLDASKGYTDFVLLNSDLEQIGEAFQLDDTAKGHDSLREWIEEVLNSQPMITIYCGVESTGGFENNWFKMLFDLGAKLPIKVTRLNPARVKGSINGKSKQQVTDALSAFNIAEYLVRFSDQVDYDQKENKYRAFRSLNNHIRLAKKQKTQLINELKQILYYCFPELQRYCKQSIPTWVLNMLIEYPTPKKLSRAKPEKLARIKGITLEKAQKLILKSKNSIASRGEFTDGFMIENIAREIQLKQVKITSYQKHLSEQCVGVEVDLLKTVKGIGIDSAVVIMIEIETIHRFKTPKQLCSYFGLYPTIRESGDKKYVSRMSKSGRSAIRATLFMCANSAVLHDAHFRAIYQKHRAKGLAHKQAIGVIMHKMLRIIWGILKSQKPYNPELDKTNQQKAEGQKQKAVQETPREYDDDAPISRIETKKRKVLQKSHFGLAEKMRDQIEAPLVQT
jgi:transposase